MLFCKLNILKQDEDGKWYKPKNQHRIRRFFVYDIFYRFVWAAEWFLFEKYRQYIIRNQIYQHRNQEQSDDAACYFHQP